MASFNWKDIPAKALEVCGITIPKEVGGIFSNNLTYKGYSLKLRTSGWELFDDHGTRIDNYPNTEAGKKSGLLGLLRSPASDEKAMRLVLKDEASFRKELAQGGLPEGFGPWGALKICGFHK